MEEGVRWLRGNEGHPEGSGGEGRGGVRGGVEGEEGVRWLRGKEGGGGWLLYNSQFSNADLHSATKAALLSFAQANYFLS